MIANRFFSYLILWWVIGKINTNRKNILNFSFIDEFQGSSLNKTLVLDFKNNFSSVNYQL